MGHTFKFTRLLLIALTLFMSAAPIRAQQLPTLYKQTPELLSIYNELNEMFPMRYLEQGNCCHFEYYLNYYFKDDAEYKLYDLKMNTLLERMEAVPAFRKFTEDVDSAGIKSKRIVLTKGGEIYGQKDYCRLEYANTGVYFYYRITNPTHRENALPLSRKVYDELAEMFDSYTHRSGVIEQNVYYKHADYGRFLSGGPASFLNAKKYMVPNCSRKDLCRFYDFGYKHMRNEYIYISFSDVYWDFESYNLVVLTPDSKTVMAYGAALVGDTLHLIRGAGDDWPTDNNRQWKGWILPRAWALDNPYWDFDYINKKLGYRKGRK